APPVTAQVEQPHRFELRLGETDAGLRVTPASTQGLILHRFVRSQQDHFLELIRLDTTFEERWRGSIPIERNMAFIAAVTRKSHACFLFHALTAKYFELYVLDHESGQYRQYTIKTI